MKNSSELKKQLLDLKNEMDKAGPINEDGVLVMRKFVDLCNESIDLILRQTIIWLRENKQNSEYDLTDAIDLLNRIYFGNTPWLSIQKSLSIISKAFEDDDSMPLTAARAIEGMIVTARFSGKVFYPGGKWTTPFFTRDKPKIRVGI